MTTKVRKAVFPVAGLGTRFLPATKVVAKELLPVVDRPLIEYAVAEAAAAGIEEFIFVTGRGKGAIEDHFDLAYELNDSLRAKNKTAELELIAPSQPAPGTFSFTRQQQPLGLGHAVWCARKLVGDEPFAVLLADDLVLADRPCLAQMVDAFDRKGGNIVAVMDVPREHTARYGILDTGAEEGRLVAVEGLVEKPDPAEAPSTLSIIGRYILQPEIFSHLDRHERGAGNEIQLTDAMARMLGQGPFFGYRFEGERFDCGNKVGFLEANIAFALARDDMKADVARVLDRFTENS